MGIPLALLHVPQGGAKCTAATSQVSTMYSKTSQAWASDKSKETMRHRGLCRFLLQSTGRTLYPCLWAVALKTALPAHNSMKTICLSVVPPPKPSKSNSPCESLEEEHEATWSVSDWAAGISAATNSADMTAFFEGWPPAPSLALTGLRERSSAPMHSAPNAGPSHSRAAFPLSGHSTAMCIFRQPLTAHKCNPLPQR